MTGWRELSPFVFDGLVPPDQLVGRDVEASRLREWARSGRATVLVGPRRFGKTSLLYKVKADSERIDRMPVIIADLYEVASLTDLVLRLERAWAEHAPHRLRRTIGTVFAGAQVGLNVGGTGFSMRLADQPRTDPLPALHTLLGLPTKLSGKGERVVVVLDEFQSIGQIPGAEALIRSHAQHQRSAAAYIFSGSQPSMLDQLFADRARPFYGQAERFTLGRIDPAVLATAVSDRFEQTNRDAASSVGELMAISEGHPQRAMLLAHLLWQLVDPDSPADDTTTVRVLDEAMEFIGYEAVATMSALSAAENKALRAVAEYATPYSARAGRDLDLPKATAQRAVRKLTERTVVERVPDGSWRLVDPLFGRWLRRRYPTRPR